MKKYYIFDMDGTLINSMHDWHKEIAIFKQELAKNSEHSFKEKGSLLTSPDDSDFMEPVFDKMREHYRNTIDYKDGVVDFLNRAKNAGIKMCIATGTRRDVAEPFLEKSGIVDYMEFYLSCFDVGKFKDFPDIYLESAKRLGADIKDCIVFEDSGYSGETAKNAGFFVAGIYDKSTIKEGDVKPFSDIYIGDWTEMAGKELP